MPTFASANQRNAQAVIDRAISDYRRLGVYAQPTAQVKPVANGIDDFNAMSTADKINLVISSAGVGGRSFGAVKGPKLSPHQTRSAMNRVNFNAGFNQAKADALSPTALATYGRTSTANLANTGVDPAWFAPVHIEQRVAAASLPTKVSSSKTALPSARRTYAKHPSVAGIAQRDGSAVSYNDRLDIDPSVGYHEGVHQSRPTMGPGGTRVPAYNPYEIKYLNSVVDQAAVKAYTLQTGRAMGRITDLPEELDAHIKQWGYSRGIKPGQRYNSRRMQFMLDRTRADQDDSDPSMRDLFNVFKTSEPTNRRIWRIANRKEVAHSLPKSTSNKAVKTA